MKMFNIEPGTLLEEEVRITWEMLDSVGLMRRATFTLLGLVVILHDLCHEYTCYYMYMQSEI